MTELAITVILVVVGLVNFAPLAGVISSTALGRAYGIDPPTGDQEILLRHRAVLFGLVGALIIASAFRTELQILAVVMGAASMLSFVALAWSVGTPGPKIRKVVAIDVGACVLLAVVPLLWFTQ